MSSNTFDKAHGNATAQGEADPSKANETRLTLALTAIELLRATNSINSLVLRGAHGHTRDTLLKRLLTNKTSHRLPANTNVEALQGSIDPCASIIRGAQIQSESILSNQAIDCFVLSNAECWSNASLHYLKTVWEKNQIEHKVFVALDESGSEDSGFTDYPIADLFPLHVDIPELPYATMMSVIEAFDAVHANVNSKLTSKSMTVSDALIREWIGVAQALDIPSVRAIQHCLACATAIAYWHEHEQIEASDSVMAVQLVLGPRARQLAQPDANDANEQSQQDNANSDSNDSPDETEADETDAQETDTNKDLPQEPASQQHTNEPDTKESSEPAPNDVTEIPETLIAAAQATLPAHLLAGLASHQRINNAKMGRDASKNHEHTSGRPIGVKRARRYGHGERLNLLATLQQAAPWQRMREQQRKGSTQAGNDNRKLIVHPSDLQVTRFSAPVRNTTVFVVDASGSAAMQRLAEAKGAVELLLNECYVRRDRVALITFRGEHASLDLPPTRSLVRAKRALQGLPGGGGTPLANGLQLMASLISQLQRAGESTVGVVLSDGKANISLGKSKSRELARQDALQQANILRSLNTQLIFVDTASRPQALARQIAQSMDAQYLPLPHGQQHQLMQQINGTEASVAL